MIHFYAEKNIDFEIVLSNAFADKPIEPIKPKRRK
jgi:hypothetical protein